MRDDPRKFRCMQKGCVAAQPRCKGGSRTWTRTRDPLINSQLLYQLSYSGTSRGFTRGANGVIQRVC